MENGLLQGFVFVLTDHFPRRAVEQKSGAFELRPGNCDPIILNDWLSFLSIPNLQGMKRFEQRPASGRQCWCC